MKTFKHAQSANIFLQSGFIPPILTNGSLVLLWCLFGILFYYKGKTFRRW